MSKKILITGISGFIGRHVARLLATKKGLEIHAIIRPGTLQNRIGEFDGQFIFHQIDLTDIDELKKYLQNNSFDIIYHIGALRGGRKFSKKAFFDANVNATEQLAITAQRNDSLFIFCSSVGVFGAIPLQLPANNKTKRQEDNYYHYTKIRSELIIQKMVLYGLRAVIIRPAITYGIGDYGFPYTLIKLVDKKLMFLPKNEVIIHLSSAEYLAEIFLKLLDFEPKSGSAYNVADLEPVNLQELVDFISKELKNKSYPASRNINPKYFRWAENLARKFKSELWISRFELISKSWYYDIENTRNELAIKPPKTIPNFKNIINWYKSEGK
ncbi:MAG: NAD(P)-dependent oxidoreductase [Candidatus Cloacimonetes bacterium]|nr:NAD(P)-dependent oxidoreductase [Candidatus Cloacimonadota bacterium]MCF7814503.1 NAD(P)-dependent oxidoreductase [Candidatus Cloacimonadota bacterium]MCF7869062.1 NAD(P)-dependent oxidoreductase [Candidatus Cloacimonadota bacterium]MCF7884457.1 NAD(P)-dependent oxidoreductase [Candidatus Cloacimonadota bacterium]